MRSLLRRDDGLGASRDDGRNVRDDGLGVRGLPVGPQGMMGWVFGTINKTAYSQTSVFLIPKDSGLNTGSSAPCFRCF